MFKTTSRTLLTAGLSLAATAAIATPAFADTVEVGYSNATTLDISGDDTVNRIDVDRVGSDLRISNLSDAAIRLATGTYASRCRLAAGDPSVALCTPPSSKVYVDLGAGADVFDADPGYTDGTQATVPFEIYGGTGNDEIYGGAGDDHIEGEAGDDYVEGGAGNDTIFGDDGEDQLFGGAGNDHLEGGLNDDQLDGDAGADTLFGHEGADILSGGADNDHLEGGIGDDELNGDAGNDELLGDAGDDGLYGGPGNDDLQGDAGKDELYGEEGDDYLDSDDGVAESVNDCGVGNDSWYGDKAGDGSAACETTRVQIVGTPAVTGTATVGETVNAGPVTFAGTPAVATYKWRSCNVSGGSCITHQDSANPSFTILPAAAGRMLFVEVGVSNAITTRYEVTSARVAVPALPTPPAPTPTPTPNPPVPVAAATFPAAGKVTVSKRGSGFRVFLNQGVTCRANGATKCNATLVATAKRGSKTVKVGTDVGSIGGGKTVKAAFPLNNTGAKLLRSQGKLKVTVTIQVRQSGSATVTKTFTYTLKRPKR